MAETLDSSIRLSSFSSAFLLINWEFRYWTDLPSHAGNLLTINSGFIHLQNIHRITEWSKPSRLESGIAWQAVTTAEKTVEIHLALLVWTISITSTAKIWPLYLITPSDDLNFLSWDLRYDKDTSSRLILHLLFQASGLCLFAYWPEYSDTCQQGLNKDSTSPCWVPTGLNKTQKRDSDWGHWMNLRMQIFELWLHLTLALPG